MTSENTKIIINEVDKTKPGGSGIAPSDIVFVPGLSVLPDAPKNTPILVNDYLEFERYFGTTPAILTSRDVEGYTEYGYAAGDYDKSYIYAKELLFQGMPVIYSNVVDEANVETPDIVASSLKLTDPTDVIKNLKVEDAKTSGILISFNTKRDTKTEGSADNTIEGTIVTLSLKTKVKIDKGDMNQPTTTTFELNGEIADLSAENKISVKSISINEPTSVTSVTTKYLKNNVVEFISTSEKVYDHTLDVVIELDITKFVHTDDAGKNSFTVNLYETPASKLDVFYEKTSVIKDQLNLIADKSIYSVKYITSGGYPSVISSADGKQTIKKFASEMIAACANRGDAVALIDYMFNPDDVPFDKDITTSSFYSKMSEAFDGEANAEYGAVFYPWGNYSCGSSLSNVDGLESDDVYMPPSFAYMICLARAIKTSPNWLAMAGVSRGIVPKLNNICTPANVLSNAIAEEMQPKFGKKGHKLSINCITNIRPYGLTLWGNRTMKEVNKEGCVALNFLNTRNMLSDIKKVLYSTAKSLMFEQNSDTLWLRFKSGITPLLERLKTGNGLEDYRIVRGTTKYNGDPLQKGEISAVIKIYPLYAVEYFELTVEINDKDVTVV